MEAALRTAVKLITGAEAPSPEFNDVRGMKNIKEAQYEVGGLNVKVAVASGTKNAGYLMDKIKDDPEEIRLTGKAEKNLRCSKKKSASVQTEKTA